MNNFTKEIFKKLFSMYSQDIKTNESPFKYLYKSKETKTRSRNTKLFFSFLMMSMLLSLESNAQVFHFGLKGGLNRTEIQNNNYQYSEPALSPNNYLFSSGYFEGISFGIFMPKRIGNFFAEYGIQLELLKNIYNQKYTRKVIKDNAPSEYLYSTNLYTTDIPLLFRMNTHFGIFTEMGIQYSKLYNVNETIGNLSLNRSFADRNTTLNYSQDNTSILGGLGMNFSKLNKLAVNIGVRFSYGLNDLTSPQADKTKDYQATHTFAYGITAEVSYRLLKYNDTRNHKLKQFEFRKRK